MPLRSAVQAHIAWAFTSRVSSWRRSRSLAFADLSRSSSFCFCSTSLSCLSIQNCSSSWRFCNAIIIITFTSSKNYYYYNHFMTLCLGLPRWVNTRRINHSGFWWSKHDGVALAEPYASYLHFAPCARCPSWHPTNSIKALKAILITHTHKRLMAFFPGQPG